MHGHLPLVPPELANQREVEVGAANYVSVLNPGRAPILLEQCWYLQHLLGIGEPRTPFFLAAGFDGKLDVLKSPVEVREDRMLGELKATVVGYGEL